MSPAWRLLVLALPVAGGSAGCEDGIGEPGTSIPQPLPALSGGVVFSTWVLDGADGYDLFWAPAPDDFATGEQGFIQLTTTGSNDAQPSVAASGAALVFAREDRGIFLVDAGGDVSEITDTRDTPFIDSLPALSPEGDRVAWVREDTSRPVGQSGLVVTEIWIADADGANARPVNPKPNVVQDAPAFDPTPRRARLAWSELNAATLGAAGPVDYGVWVHDLEAAGGRFVCQGEYVDQNGFTVRCFGQHLSWPRPDRIVLDQQLLEIDPATGPVRSGLGELLDGLASAPGSPDRTSSPSGFFPPFPLSASFLGDRMIVDGVFSPFDGDVPTVAFFIASNEAAAVARPTGPARFRVAGHRGDLDPGNTAGYLFSLATPQLMP